MNNRNEPQKNVPINVYGTLELLKLHDQDAENKTIKRVLIVNNYKNELDLANFVNQNEITELVEIAFNPHVVNIIGSTPWKLFFWGYCAIPKVKGENENVG